MEILVFACIIIGILGIIGVLIVIAIKSNPKNKNSFFNDSIGMLKRMMDENEDVLREMSTKSADISSKGIEIKARAIKKGLSGEVIFCKYCGAEIDSDSKFCKQCGKEQ